MDDILFTDPKSRSLWKPMMDVVEFHKKFGVPIRAQGKPAFPSQEEQQLRMDLIEEEFSELYRAWDYENMVEVADALADLIYVCIGMALSFGIPLDVIWEEVHRTNMAKEGGGNRADGKILKPEGWEPPRIKEILALDGYEE